MRLIEPSPGDKAVVLRQDPLPSQSAQGGFVRVFLGQIDALGPRIGLRPEVTVPTIQSGTPVEAAQAALRDVDLCAQLDPPGLAAAVVINEVPPSGTPVRRGTTVTLQVGIGVPDVVGQSLDDAKAALMSAGLTAGEITREPSDRPVGTVTAQDPSAGSPAAPGRPVGLTVAAAPAVTVPKVVGSSFDEAKKTLDQAGFPLGQVDRLASREAPGTVVAQAPGVGEPFVPPLPRVNLTLAAIKVPDVVGSTLGSARRTLADAGLKSVEAGWPRIFFATVVGQTPPSDSLLISVQDVTLTVGSLGDRSVTVAAGVLLVTVASIVISRAKGSGKQPPPPARPVRISVHRDSGNQEIRLGGRDVERGSPLAIEPEVRLRPVQDSGTQQIEPSEGLLKFEEGTDHG